MDTTTEVTETGVGETGATSTGASTTTDTTASTGDTEDTGDTGDPLASCLDADFPVTAPLCGADGPPCGVLRDELVSGKQAFRNDTPAIALDGACEPQVLFSEAVGGYFGFFAERVGADTWQVEPTPFSVATGSLETDPGAGATFVLADDGAYNVTLWQRTDGPWVQESALAGQNHARASQLVRDGQGALHLGHIDGSDVAHHEVYDGAWSKEQLLTSADINVRIAVDGEAAAHLVGWTSKDATWNLQFMAPPAVSEVITPLGSNVLGRAHTALALLGEPPTPWVLLARQQADQSHHDIVLAHRTGPAAWEIETLAAEDAQAETTCDLEPVAQGQLCMYDYTRLHPLALLASASELRALYLAIRYQGAMEAECQPMPFPFCAWTLKQDDSSSELRVAWPGSQTDEHEVVAVDVFTDRATSRLDAAGGIHLAFYDDPPAGGDPVVRYLLLGP